MNPFAKQPITFLLIPILLMVSSLFCFSQGLIDLYGSPDNEDGRGFYRLSSGEKIISGIHTTSGTSNTELFLMRIASGGNILWDKRYDLPYPPSAFRSIPTSDGGFVGAIQMVVNGQSDWGVVKLDASGNVSWANRISGTRKEALGDLAETSTGNFVISGWSETPSHGPFANPSPSPGQPDGFLIELSPTGTLNWAWGYGGSLGDQFYRIKTTPMGNIAVGRSFSSQLDGFLVATNTSGTSTHRLRFSTSSPERLFDILPTSDGGYLLTGHFKFPGEDILLIKLNSAFAVQWSKTYEAGGRENGVRLLEKANHYYVSGNSNAFGNDYDALVLKTDLNGNLVWARTYGDANRDAGRDIHDAGSSIQLMMNTSSYGSGLNDIGLINFTDSIDSCATDVTQSITTTVRTFSRNNYSSAQNVTAAITVTPFTVTPSNANFSRTIEFCGTSTTIPTLSQWGLILLALGIVSMGSIVVWRRRYRVA